MAKLCGLPGKLGMDGSQVPSRVISKAAGTRSVATAKPT